MSDADKSELAYHPMLAEDVPCRHSWTCCKATLEFASRKVPGILPCPMARITNGGACSISEPRFETIEKNARSLKL